MKRTELLEVRRELETFAAEVLPDLKHPAQRANSVLYLRGLLLDGARKSLEPMCDRLRQVGDVRVKDPAQSLQQFLVNSHWDERTALHRAAQKVLDVAPPQALVIDDTTFPKSGKASVGAARQWCGMLGKVTLCQDVVSLHAASAQASVPLGWRVFLPEAWVTDMERRAKVGVPPEVVGRKKWEIALDLLDEATGAGLAPDVPVTADAGFGDASEFRTALTSRNRSYVVAVKGDTHVVHADVSMVTPPSNGKGRPPKPAWTSETAAALMGREVPHLVSWREGDGFTSRFAVLPVRTVLQDQRRKADLPIEWLLAEWVGTDTQPSRFWLSTLPDTTPIETLVYHAKLRWRIETDYREMKVALGLDHYEGRTWVGFHHHLGLVSIAHAWCTLRRLDPKARAQTSS